MDKQSQIKVLLADFTIIRDEDYPTIRIKFIDRRNREWKTLEKFETKAERNRRMALLLEHTHIIRD